MLQVRSSLLKKKAKFEGENVSRDDYFLRKREKTDDATEKMSILSQMLNC